MARRRGIGKALLRLVIQRFASQPTKLCSLANIPDARRLCEGACILLRGSTHERWVFPRALPRPERSHPVSS
ncbi:GNAT family N-acetyltransferase [Tateyamaria sp. SN6-1]|uniref:GNAT family N-acetyltransferase n=1 Tax=Tateyamaria sp. SN6-1 TaxID=3092148 RepID=UPI0039F5369C